MPGRGQRRRPGDERVEDLRLGRRPGRGLDGLERRGDLGQRRLGRRVGRMPGLREHLARRRSRRPTSGRRRGAWPRGRRPPRASTEPPSPAQPTPIERWSASGNGRPVRNTAAIGSSSGVRPRRYSARIAVFSDVFVVAATRSAISVQRRMIAMVYGVADAPSPVVPGSSRRRSRHPAPPRAGEPARLHALVPGSRGRPATRYQDGPMRAEEIERFFTMRSLGPDSHGDGHPRPGHEPPDRVVRVQPARRRQRLGAVPHHDRRARRLGPRLRQRGDPADGRPRLRLARPAPGGAVGVRVQRAGDPGLPAGAGS